MITPNPQGQPATMSPSQASQLTSYLYGLKTPEAVQAYAARHQHDINVVGIASGVANAMKRVRQQPAQPQPSVTQEAIAQMAPRAQMPQQMPQQEPQMPPQGQSAPQLPEESGIGQLPVPSMQSMAGGGITGEPVHMDHGTRRFEIGGINLNSPGFGEYMQKVWKYDPSDFRRLPQYIREAIKLGYSGQAGAAAAAAPSAAAPAAAGVAPAVAGAAPAVAGAAPAAAPIANVPTAVKTASDLYASQPSTYGQRALNAVDGMRIFLYSERRLVFEMLKMQEVVGLR